MIRFENLAYDSGANLQIRSIGVVRSYKEEAKVIRSSTTFSFPMIIGTGPIVVGNQDKQDAV